LFSGGGRIVGYGAAGRIEPVRQRDQPLRDAVVDVGRQPAPFHLLGLDHLLHEVLVCAFPGHQLTVQPSLMQRAGDEPTDDQQQFDISIGELAALRGMHIEHADESAGIGLHRHRHHRGEVASAQRLKRHVARVGFLVVADHNGLTVAGHPPGDALAERQPDLAHLLVERRCRTGEGQRPVRVVEHVNKADITGGGSGDHAGGRRRKRFDPGAARRRLDQFAQQHQLAVGGQNVRAGMG
jgi:hypothetical protein